MATSGGEPDSATSSPGSSPEAGGRLDSWKEIASYLRRSVRTVNRWEEQQGLPVHRHTTGTVYAYKSELDGWWLSHRQQIEQEPLDKTLPPASILKSARIRDAVVAVPAVPDVVPLPIFQGNHESLLPMPAAKTSAAEPHRAARRFGFWIGGAIMIAVAGIGTTSWLALPKAHPIAPRLIPLTSDPGNERQPSLSPDGNFVAYGCEEPGKPDSADICVKAVGVEEVQRLTKIPAVESWPSWPAWSPDGSEIVFGRTVRGAAPAFQDFDKELGIFVVSRQGGPERKISETGAFAGWTPDGKSILILDHLKSGEPNAIFQVDLETLRRHRLTSPPVGENDWRFEVSPDSKTLAFIRFSPERLGDLYLVPMGGGEPRRLTDWHKYLTGVTWTPDSKELVYSVDRRLWRVSARLDRPGRGSPIPDIPMPAIGLSMSRPGPGRLARLAFVTAIGPRSLRRIDLNSPAPGGMIQGVLPFAAATRINIPGRFSSDGSRVAFVSNRSTANLELWVADGDGGRPRQITRLDSAERVHAGSWSPDGKRLLFDAAINGNHDVYTISAEGGMPVRLTTAPTIDWVAEWSKDGKWVYYSSGDSTTRSNIWRIPAEGGRAEQITSQGGFEPQLSSNGQDLYYLDRPPLAGSARLMRIQTGGGNAKMLMDGVTPFLWCVTEIGIYFMGDDPPRRSIHLYRFADEKIERLGALPFQVPNDSVPGRFTVSRDGRWALVNVIEQDEGDLMLLDNFR